MAKKTGMIISVIVGVIVALLVAIGVAGYYIYNSGSSSSAEGTVKLANTGYMDPESYEEGKGIYVSHKGVGELDASLPTLEIYMDYTCIHCVNFEKARGKEVEDLVKAGKINVIYRPVNVLQQEYSKYLSSAVIDLVKSEDKDKFLTFHNKVSTNVADYFESKDDSKLTAEYIEKMAKEVGISDAVIADFRKAKNDSYIDTTMTRWVNRPLFKDQQIGTPSFVLDGKIYAVPSGSLEEGIKEFLASNK